MRHETAATAEITVGPVSAPDAPEACQWYIADGGFFGHTTVELPEIPAHFCGRPVVANGRCKRHMTLQQRMQAERELQATAQNREGVIVAQQMSERLGAHVHYRLRGTLGEEFVITRRAWEARK